MAIVSDTILKSFFKKGDKPTESQFSALIDSMVNKLDDAQLLGLRVYDPERVYVKGDATLFNLSIYTCIAMQTTGAFVSGDWEKVAGGTEGGLTYKGTWEANDNLPDLTALTPSNGDYYVVSVAGETDLSGITSWEIGDWAIYNGDFWQKINNSGIVTSGADYDVEGVGVYGELIGTVLTFKRLASPFQSVSISDDANEKQVLLDINFDDEHVSETRTWSSKKIQHDLELKASRVSDAVAGNFVSLDEHGNIQDSGKSADDFMPAGGGGGSQVSLAGNASSEDVSQNRTATFMSKLKMEFTPSSSGLYMGYWYFELGSTEQGVQMEAKVMLNGQTMGETMLISRHGLSAAYESVSGMKIENLAGGTDYSMEIQFRKRVSEVIPVGPFCLIRRARLVVFKA